MGTHTIQDEHTHWVGTENTLVHIYPLVVCIPYGKLVPAGWAFITATGSMEKTIAAVYTGVAT